MKPVLTKMEMTSRGSRKAQGPPWQSVETGGLNQTDLTPLAIQRNFVRPMLLFTVFVVEQDE
jgi:hypothetical protein